VAAEPIWEMSAYSPDLNPIEQAWSKLKASLRATGARSRETLEAALGPALAAISAQDASGWFYLAGYLAPDNRDANRSNGRIVRGHRLCWHKGETDV
jgi:hypothetical protein